MRIVARSISASALCGIALVVATPGPASAQYTVVDLGTLNGNWSEGWGISEAGHVTGRASTDGPDHAFLWENGQMTDIGALNAYFSRGRAVNSSTQVVGYSRTITDHLVTHAFLWDNGNMVDLGTFGGENSRAFDINDAGQVVGFAEVAWAGSVQRGFLWEEGAMTELPPLPLPDHRETTAMAINNAAQVVGLSRTSSTSDIRACLWEGGTPTDLGTLGGTLSYGEDINDVGEVVGYSVIGSRTDWRAFFWADGTMHDLHAGGNQTMARAINNDSDVVGTMEVTTGSWAAALWRDSVQYNLNDLIPDDSGWQLIEAYDINDNGWIVGIGRVAGEDGTLRTRGFLLVPEPATLGLLALGGLAVLRRRR